MSEYIVDVRGQMPDVVYENQREEIVRCRDCKHASSSGATCYHWMTLDVFENPVPSHVEPDRFCAWGKRRNK